MNQNNFSRSAQIFRRAARRYFSDSNIARPASGADGARPLSVHLRHVVGNEKSRGSSAKVGGHHVGDERGADSCIQATALACGLFNQDLRPGDYPLQTWNPDDAVKIAASIKKFIGDQHYAKSTRFEALQPLLNRVIVNSERLTVIIFCDGETPISGTPFDAGINQAFQEKLAKQKSARQPFVIELRSQLGQYVNCAMGFRRSR